MAAKLSRRARNAASHGGARTSPSSKPAGERGFLERVGQSRVGRKVIAPALTSLGLASQLQADKSRAQQSASSKAPSTTRAGRPVLPTTRAGVQPGKSGPSKLNPLPPGMSLESRFGAEQQRDRLASQAHDTGMLADAEATGDGTFLELPTRSYARPEETEGEKEMTRQQGMMKTMRQFLAPSGEAIGVASGPREERGSGDREMGDHEEDEEELEDLAMEDAEMEEEADDEQTRAETLAREQQQEQQEQALADQAASVAQNRNGQVENLKRVKRLWQAVSGAEVAASETGVPLLMLALQLNVQVINEYFFRVKMIPSTSFPEKVGCCCLDLVVCGAIFASCIAYLFPLIIVIYALNNPWDSVSELMKAAIGR